jgi:hypothetical protein
VGTFDARKRIMVSNNNAAASGGSWSAIGVAGTIAGWFSTAGTSGPLVGRLVAWSRRHPFRVDDLTFLASYSSSLTAFPFRPPDGSQHGHGADFEPMGPNCQP